MAGKKGQTKRFWSDEILDFALGNDAFVLTGGQSILGVSEIDMDGNGSVDSLRCC